MFILIIYIKNHWLVTALRERTFIYAKSQVSWKDFSVKPLPNRSKLNKIINFNN